MVNFTYYANIPLLNCVDNDQNQLVEVLSSLHKDLNEGVFVNESLKKIHVACNDEKTQCISVNKKGIQAAGPDGNRMDPSGKTYLETKNPRFSITEQASQQDC